MVSFNSIDMPIQVDGSTTIPVKQLYMYIKRSSKLRIRILLGTIFTGISTINQQKYGPLHHPCKLRILHGALLDGIVLTIWTLYIAIFRNFPLHYPCNLSLSTHNSTSHLGEGKRRCGAAVVVQSWKGMFFTSGMRCMSQTCFFVMFCYLGKN